MPPVTVAEIYRKARQGGYGVAGFCADSMDMALAILKAAEEAGAPVVVTLWQEDVKSVGLGYLESVVRYGASQARVPVAMMLDHGADLQICLRSILLGHSAVMIDASHRSLEQNIAVTRHVCEVAHAVSAIVEGELGTVRRSFENDGEYAEETVYTDPAQVRHYVEQTGVDALAVSVGSESGVLDTKTPLDYERLCAIANSTDAHLVLHGGSGISAADVQRAVASGVTAFRFASEMRVAYLNALETARAALPRTYPDTRPIFEPARDAARKLILARMEQLGCVGKAW